ncbi:MAG: biotin synthase BioB [Verrucomicrobia bacterium]|nr:MAG: biotin synthase BioB [Verrucomicrobiota bacterium]
MNWNKLADDVLAGRAVTREDALVVLNAPDDELLAVLDAAFRVRRKYFGRKVNLHLIRNAKSGNCSEDCAYCSQSSVSTAPIERYVMQSADELFAGAQEAARAGAVKYCMVTAGRGPSPRVMDTVCLAAERITKELKVRLCVSLGTLTDEQAQRLKAAGVKRYNHNLESSRRFFPEICTTHTWDERVATVRRARAAGLEACCGGLLGMGETLEDRVDLALTLRELEVEAMPVNLFNPRAGTPLAGRKVMTPAEGLKALAMFRLVNPRAEVRAAGGREAVLGAMQPLALYPANSIFTQGYLTTLGQGSNRDVEMLTQAGFEVGQVEG